MHVRLTVQLSSPLYLLDTAYHRRSPSPSPISPRAAAAAVVIVIAVTAVTVGPATRTRAPAIAPGGAVTGPMPPGPSLASYVSSGTIPPYFVAVAFTGEAAQSPAVAVVHDTVSGHALATIRP